MGNILRYNMKFKNVTLCLLITALVFVIGGCNKVNDENIQSENIDYSKYIGTYSIVSDEDTKYESKQTLIIKSIDGKTLDFEYELVPYRHEITITAEQGVFSSKTTAEALGTYNIDGQVMPYGFEFKFNDNSIDLKCGFTDELNGQEYITFYLESKNDISGSGKSNNTDDKHFSSNGSSTSSSSDKQKITRYNNSTGIDNQYTEAHKNGTGYQFTMTIDEFIEKYNETLAGEQWLFAETGEDTFSSTWNGSGYKELNSLDLEQAIITNDSINGESVIKYKFENILNHTLFFSVNILCYKDTKKICAVYCQVSDKWYEGDSVCYVIKDKSKQIQSRDDYANIPVRFQQGAYRIFNVVNPDIAKSADIATIFKSGANCISFIDNVSYRYYDFTEDNGNVFHGLLMYADSLDNTKTLTVY